MNYAAEAYKRITGVDPPKAYSERTPAERQDALDRFFATVNASSDEDDDAVDEFFKGISMNPILQNPDFSDWEEESA